MDLEKSSGNLVLLSGVRRIAKLYYPFTVFQLEVSEELVGSEKDIPREAHGLVGVLVLHQISVSKQADKDAIVLTKNFSAKSILPKAA
jgi:hypothetical protein